MILSVDFVSKSVFAQLRPVPDLVAISIGDPAEAAPASLTRYERALRLEFLDCDLEGMEKWGFPLEALCAEAQVIALLQFVEALHAQPAPYRVAVHCHAGASRSAAVALVVQAATKCCFPRLADAHYANRLVVQRAAALLGRDIAVPPIPVKGERHEYLPSGKML